jgi:protein-S-isoprenylcysteine O-methyltransferase Ste14
VAYNLGNVRERGSDVSPSGDRGGGWVAGQLVAGGVVVVVGLLGSGWPSGVRVAFTVAGIALAVLGSAMLLSGGAFLGRSLTPYPRPLPGATLRQDGVYRLVRHPMYGGVIVMGVGWSLGTSPLALVAALGLGAFLDLKSRREEAWLVEHYPGYPEYRRRTRWKFVPGLR